MVCQFTRVLLASSHSQLIFTILFEAFCLRFSFRRHHPGFPCSNSRDILNFFSPARFLFLGKLFYSSLISFTFVSPLLSRTFLLFCWKNCNQPRSPANCQRVKHNARYGHFCILASLASVCTLSFSTCFQVNPLIFPASLFVHR